MRDDHLEVKSGYKLVGYAGIIIRLLSDCPSDAFTHRRWAREKPKSYRSRQVLFWKLCYLRKISECLSEIVTISNNEVIMAWLSKTSTMLYIFKMMMMIDWLLAHWWALTFYEQSHFPVWVTAFIQFRCFSGNKEHNFDIMTSFISDVIMTSRRILWISAPRFLDSSNNFT